MTQISIFSIPVKDNKEVDRRKENLFFKKSRREKNSRKRNLLIKLRMKECRFQKFAQGGRLNNLKRSLGQ